MRPVNNYKRTKYHRGSGQVLEHPIYGTRECDCHVCEHWRVRRRLARKASRELKRQSIREARYEIG